MTDLTGRKLDLALAEATGWVPGILPRYSTSIDALAPVEAKLREAGWRIHIMERVTSERHWLVWWVHDRGDNVELRAPTEARARAEAALQALQVIQAGANT